MRHGRGKHIQKETEGKRQKERDKKNDTEGKRQKERDRRNDTEGKRQKERDRRKVEEVPESQRCLYKATSMFLLKGEGIN